LPGDPKHPPQEPETKVTVGNSNLMDELRQLEENGHNHDVQEPMQDDHFQQSEEEVPVQ
jgi:hypothetical protein